MRRCKISVNIPIRTRTDLASQAAPTGLNLRSLRLVNACSLAPFSPAACSAQSRNVVLETYLAAELQSPWPAISFPPQAP